MKKLLLLALAATSMFAADVTGKWTGEMQGRNGPQTVTFTFKAEGSQLTGTVTTPRGDNPISEGKVDGDKISFTQTMQFQQQEVKLLYKGTVSGDEIKMTREREGGDGRAQEMTLKRAK